MALALCTTAWAAVVAAQSSNAEVLAQGKDALMRADPAEAKRIFSQGLEKAKGEERWRMLLGLGLALEIGDENVEALYTYRTFLVETREAPEAKTDPWPKRRRRVIEDVAHIEEEVLASHARIELTSDPEGARVVADGEPTPHRTPAVVYLTAGEHTLRFELDDHTPELVALTLAAGQRELVHRQLDAPIAEPPPVPSAAEAAAPVPPRKAPPPPPPVTPDAPAPIDLFVPGMVTAASGAATLIVAGVLHGLALGDAEEVRSLEPTRENIPRDNELRDRIHTYQKAFISMYSVGGTMAAVGVALVIYDIVAMEPPLRAWMAPVPGGGSAGISAAW